jgi:hypothetical protein
LLQVSAALVRIETVPAAMVPNPKTGVMTLQTGSSVHVGAHFGAAHPAGPGYAPTADATNCDLNDDGKIDRTTGSPELTCDDNCEADPECSEYSNYASQNQFNMVVESLGLPAANGSPTVLGQVDIQGDGSTDAQFDPLLSKGQTIRAFSGTLYYFSGGAQFTIQARCADDIITDLTASPIPSDTACVHARTILDTDDGSN